MDRDKNCFYVDVGKGSHMFLVFCFFFFFSFLFLRQALSVTLGVLLCSVDEAGLKLYKSVCASLLSVRDICSHLQLKIKNMHVKNSRSSLLYGYKNLDCIATKWRKLAILGKVVLGFNLLVHLSSPWASPLRIFVIFQYHKYTYAKQVENKSL